MNTVATLTLIGNLIERCAIIDTDESHELADKLCEEHKKWRVFRDEISNHDTYNFDVYCNGLVMAVDTLLKGE
jgi:hypothetical protein